jgi:PTH1 family peptidyl-tRNA hydrolase
MLAKIMFYIVGLGNPGEKYLETRHNAGRAAVTGIEIKGAKIITPDSFMNKSGEALKNFQFSIFNFQNGKKKKGIKNLVVVHDDLDLPFGSFKISFNKSSGGHKGVQSVMDAVKTEAFTRVRIGISPTTPSGKLKKPRGEADVERCILGKFKPAELTTLKKLHKKIAEAIQMIVSESREKAMSEFN